MTRDGGPAFPIFTPDMPVEGSPGMSLRDWFAGMALAGKVAAETDESFWMKEEYPTLARRCYEMADAMLAARGASDDA